MGGRRRPLTLLMEEHAAIGMARAKALDWIGVLFAAAALVLVPWVVFLVRALPSHHRSAHWDVAWGGFDIALALLLVGVAAAAWRRSPWLEGAATAAATLLLVDVVRCLDGLEPERARHCDRRGRRRRAADRGVVPPPGTLG